MTTQATLKVGETTVELPVITGTQNEVAVDITKLRAQTGMITLDSGYMNTGACQSAITFLNGEKGILQYRGIAIEDLCEKSSFTEVSYLLINGDLPSQAQLEEFEARIASHTELPKDIVQMIRTFPRSAHPMGVLSSVMVALSAHYPEYQAQDLTDDQKANIIPMLMAHTKLICGEFYRYTLGLESIPSNKSYNYSKDFLNVMFGEEKCTDEIARALDVLLILHADHEQNCSASTVRLVGSSKANLFASISGGICALWGPLHGGANQAVIEMLDAIQADGGDHKRYLDKAKDKDDPFRLMGFGHRVYKNFDPRARIIKGYCDLVLDRLGIKDPILDIAKGLEEEALKDPYFAERKLYPNVDFYSGIIYRALGIPTNFFTGMFVLGRMPGWIAQWKEMIEDPAMKIGRPRQVYTGETAQNYRPLSER